MKQIPIFEGDEMKRYYSIGEVARMFEISKSQLRFWENEFDFLKPHKNSKGDRRFTHQNLEQLKLIQHLLKERGFTIDGARQEIKRLQEWEQEKKTMIELLGSIKSDLQNLLDQETI